MTCEHLTPLEVLGVLFSVLAIVIFIISYIAIWVSDKGNSDDIRKLKGDIWILEEKVNNLTARKK